jgi:hypothetical protein
MPWVVVLAVVASASTLARAGQPDGFSRTGSGIQTANHWPFTIEVFAISHECKRPPARKTRQAMIELEADKRFSLRMLRDIDAAKLRAGLRDGYRRNHYDDDARIGQFLSALSGALPQGKQLWITYDASRKSTRLTVDGGGTAVVDGPTFMKATWSIWFGLSKPAELGDALIKDL